MPALEILTRKLSAQRSRYEMDRGSFQCLDKFPVIAVSATLPSLAVRALVQGATRFYFNDQSPYEHVDSVLATDDERWRLVVPGLWQRLR